MELNVKKTSSKALLTCGNGEAFSEKLLLKPKQSGSLQTERVPRSSVLQRLQNFLPQMAEANQTLKQQMEAAPAGKFDIESVEEAERVIEMDVALVELGDEDTEEEETSSSDEEEEEEEESDSDEEKLVLPGDKDKKKKKKKANIEEL